jgi:uncharacterized metal-binding protein
MADSNCSCGGSNVLVFACSGASNVGQIANAAAMELDRREIARMYCLVGVSAHIGGMVDSAASADARIVIDGCPVACARQATEHTGAAVDRYVVVTELGIQKNHVFEWTAEQVERAVAAALDGSPWQTTEETLRDSCGCGSGCGCH